MSNSSNCRIYLQYVYLLSNKHVRVENNENHNYKLTCKVTKDKFEMSVTTNAASVTI